MTVEGAKKALEAGASGIVVSNHGGRVLDQCPATAEVLKEIADAVKGQMKIFVDGGIRTGVDVFKALAMGADAVAIASAAMVAAACQQYRICGTGMCPVGMATQDEKLRERLHIDSAAKRVENFLTCSANELRTFARITGNSDIHDLSVDDLCTINREISEHTNILHA